MCVTTRIRATWRARWRSNADSERAFQEMQAFFDALRRYAKSEKFSQAARAADNSLDI